MEIARSNARKVEGVDRGDEDEENGEDDGGWTDGDGSGSHLLVVPSDARKKKEQTRDASKVGWIYIKKTN